MLATVTASDIISRNPCGGYRDAERILALCTRFRRERWSALEILSVDDVSAEDRMWVCLHPSLLPYRVMVRFACEVAADAMRSAGWTDARSLAALEARLAYERGEIGADALRAARSAAWNAALEARLAYERGEIGADALRAAWNAAWNAARSAAWNAAGNAARSAAWNAARSAAWSRHVTILRTLIVLDLDGYDVLRGELGKPIPRKGVVRRLNEGRTTMTFSRGIETNALPRKVR